MLELSRKAKLMPASAIRKLVPYAEEAKKKGIKVYHLNIGQPDIESPPAAIESLKNIQEKLIAYPHSQGRRPFLEGVVKYYKTLGINLKPENINLRHYN